MSRRPAMDFFKDGAPKYVRCYEKKRNPTIDRFTVVFCHASKFMGRDYIGRVCKKGGIVMKDRQEEGKMTCIHYDPDNKACYWLWEPDNEVSICPYNGSSNEEACSGYYLLPEVLG
jgi:hypothetical protein